MKKRGIKILSAVLVVAMILSFATVALAESPQEEKPKGERNQDRTIITLFVKYAPGSLAEYLSTKQEHTQFHEGRKEAYEAFKKQTKGQLAEILDAFIEGEMTAEEFKSTVTQMRDTLKAYKEQMVSIREAKQSENEALKTQHESIKTQLETALASEVKDEVLIKSLLEQRLALLKQHLAVDYKYAAQVDAAREQYYPA